MPPAPIDPSARRRPPGRYDPPSRAPSRLLAVLLAVLLAGFLLSLAWVLYQRYGSEDVPSRVLAFDVVSDDAVVVAFEATPPEGVTAWCLVRARNEAGVEVGRVFVPVRPDAGRPVETEYRLATSDLAVTGEVPRCLAQRPPADQPTAEPAAP